MSHPDPAEYLKSGTAFLLEVLAPYGFVFNFKADGLSSGGHFAWGEFVRGDRRLEVHYRQSLGGVVYHANSAQVTHKPYMRRLGVWEHCKYPGFSLEPMQAFRDLAHDLTLTHDFLTGDASTLQAAAISERICLAEESELHMANLQAREIERMRILFKEGKYTQVIAAFEQLQFPHLLTDAQLRLVQIARKRDS